jgi:hypothetical protein
LIRKLTKDLVSDYQKIRRALAVLEGASCILMAKKDPGACSTRVLLLEAMGEGVDDHLGPADYCPLQHGAKPSAVPILVGIAVIPQYEDIARFQTQQSALGS